MLAPETSPALGRGLVALAIAVLVASTARAQIADGVGEGKLRNNTPLPTSEAAETLLARGDASWSDALTGAEADRPGARTQAFDAWRNAITKAAPGDAVRLVPAASKIDRIVLYPDPDGTHARRSEDVAVAVQRRLHALTASDRAAWITRFEGNAAAALQREVSRPTPSRAGLGEVERTFPATRSAARASLVLADLELELARPSAAMVWLGRARVHVDLGAESWPASARAAFERALDRRQDTALTAISTRFLGDHTAPQRLTPTARRPGAPLPDFSLVSRPQRISGLRRTPDEPFGRGLGSGIAFFEDGSALVQGAYGLLFLVPTGPAGIPEVFRVDFTVLFGTRKVPVMAAESAGGWSARPASDGKRIALVIGRGERRRSLSDIKVPPSGNLLGLVEHGAETRPLEPIWLLRDGIRVDRPRRGRSGGPGRDLPSPRLPGDTGGVLTQGWSIGRGWEFQPGPVLLDDMLFVLARGLGDPTTDNQDHADEVRLIALDTTTGTVRWSREVTSERGLTDPAARGRAGYFAATTMPLTVERGTGQILVGTNVGLLCAYDVADGRLTWAMRNQRRRAGGGGWPGSKGPILAGRSPGRSQPTAWFAPFDSNFAYALPAGPAPLDGGLFSEAPRARRGALELAAALPPTRAGGRSSLILLGQDGRHAAVLLEGPDGGRRPATYLAPDERFGGRPALGAEGLLVAGTRELGILSLAEDLRLINAVPIPTEGAGRGGDVILFRGRVHIVGRDTVWVWKRP